MRLRVLLTASLLVSVAACAEPQTYRLGGGFLPDLGHEEQEDWDRTVARHGVTSVRIGVSDPPVYFIEGMDRATCEALAAELKEKPYLRNQGDCRRERTGATATPW